MPLRCVVQFFFFVGRLTCLFFVFSIFMSKLWEWLSCWSSTLFDSDSSFGDPLFAFFCQLLEKA